MLKIMLQNMKRLYGINISKFLGIKELYYPCEKATKIDIIILFSCFTLLSLDFISL